MNAEVFVALLLGAVIGVWIYIIGAVAYLVATSYWFAQTWVGKAMNDFWALIRNSVQAVLPPYKR